MSLINQVEKVRTSFRNNMTRPLTFRIGQLKALQTFLNEHENEIEQALYKDMARPAMEAYMGDVAITRTEINYLIKNLARWMKPQKVTTSFVAQPGKSYIYAEPYGVVLIIAPWNYPLQLALCPLAGAIAAGNCAILKPSELAPATSQLLAKYLPNYLDARCFEVIEGGVTETTALLEQPFDYIFYTGNPSVAKIIMQAAAKFLTPLTLELGGKSPCIVDENIDITTATKRILFGKFLNAGQTCIAPDYIFVHKNSEKILLDEIKKQLTAFYGTNPKLSKDYGRIINSKHFERLKSFIKNNPVIIGGEYDESECYISPTILLNPSFDSAVMQEEIFGPILPIITFKDHAEVIAWIQKNAKPLALYLFTKDKNIEEQYLTLTSSGSVCINHTTMQYLVLNLPFGGVGQSGMGAYHGKASFDTFSHRKSVLKKPFFPEITLAYPPYKPSKKKWLRWLL